MGCGLGYNAIIPVMICIFDCAASTSFLMLCVIMLCPITERMIRCFGDLFDLLFTAYGTSKGLFALFQVCGLHGHNTIIPLMRLVSNRTASGAAVLMLFCIVFFPCTKAVFTGNGNGCCRYGIGNRCIVTVHEGGDGTGNRTGLNRLLRFQGESEHIHIRQRIRRFKHTRIQTGIHIEAAVNEHRVIHNERNLRRFRHFAGNDFKRLLIILRNKRNNADVYRIFDINGKDDFFANVGSCFGSSDGHGRTRCADRNRCKRHDDHKRCKQSRKESFHNISPFMKFFADAESPHQPFVHYNIICLKMQYIFIKLQ